MREILNIWDVDVTLSAILALLPVRAHRTEWTVESFLEADGERYFEIASGGEDPFTPLTDTGLRLSHVDFARFSDETPQIIWATFQGFDDRSGLAPWLTISAVDSSFWEIVTEELETRRKIRTEFRDVRKGKM